MRGTRKRVRPLDLIKTKYFEDIPEEHPNRKKSKRSSLGDENSANNNQSSSDALDPSDFQAKYKVK